MQYDSHPIVNDLTNISTAFPFSRSLETKNTDKTTITKLFSTRRTASPLPILRPRRFASIPPRTSTDRSRWPSPALTQAASPATPGRFVVVGNSGWASNQALGFNGNRNLLLNMINWLSSDEDLISIRPKEPEDRRINLTRAQFRMVQTTSQFFLPLIVIIGGVMVWLKRR